MRARSLAYRRDCHKIPASHGAPPRNLSATFGYLRSALCKAVVCDLSGQSSETGRPCSDSDAAEYGEAGQSAGSRSSNAHH
mmetsp:Transcript_2658/g.3824  ORF Transcript_2658/g.3824 Transcript_2658/m.3824 type:complete len:81 (+) Transcript_2658:119-361(+)